MKVKILGAQASLVDLIASHNLAKAKQEAVGLGATKQKSTSVDQKPAQLKNPVKPKLESRATSAGKLVQPALTTLALKSRKHHRRLRNLLRHHAVACVLFSFLSVREIVSRMHCLSRMTQSKVYRVAMEPALRLACSRGLSSAERIWFTLFRTKLYRLSKLNSCNFYEQQSLQPGKMKYDAEIQRDLKRTFPTVRAFRESEQTRQQLRRILNVLCVQQPNRVGYMQGMNFVAAAFLLALNFEEVTCFWGLIQLLNRMQLVLIYDFQSQKLKQLTFQAEMLLFEQLPSLAEHLFTRLGLDLQVYTVRWFLSVFFIDLPLDYAQTVLDLFLIDQFKVLIKVTLAIFSVLACRLSRAVD